MKPAHCSILQFTVILSFVYCNLVAEETSSRSIVHTLTWISSSKDPTLGKDNVFANEFILDGKNIGMVVDALPLLEKLPVSPDVTFRITYPDDADLHKEHFYTPYAPSNFIPLLVSSGVHLEFYYRGKKCDVRTYWWDLKQGLETWDETEFFLNGVSLGIGKAAQERLAKCNWGYEPALLHIRFKGNEYPYRGYDGSGGIGFSHEYLPETAHALAVQKVRKEFYSGIATNPVYLPPLRNIVKGFNVRNGTLECQLQNDRLKCVFRWDEKEETYEQPVNATGNEVGYLLPVLTDLKEVGVKLTSGKVYDYHNNRMSYAEKPVEHYLKGHPGEFVSAFRLEGKSGEILEIKKDGLTPICRIDLLLYGEKMALWKNL